MRCSALYVGISCVLLLLESFCRSHLSEIQLVELSTGVFFFRRSVESSALRWCAMMLFCCDIWVVTLLRIRTLQLFQQGSAGKIFSLKNFKRPLRDVKKFSRKDVGLSIAWALFNMKNSHQHRARQDANNLLREHQWSSGRAVTFRTACEKLKKVNFVTFKTQTNNELDH